RWALAASLITALLVPLVLGKWSFMTSLGLFMAAWIVTTAAENLWSKVMRNGLAGAKAALLGLPRGFYGMLFAHLGVAVFAIGVTVSGGFSSEKELRMDPGDTVEVGGYNFRFDGVTEVAGPNYQAVEGRVRVSRNGEDVTVLRPQKRVYTVQRNPMTEAGIDAGLFRHLYVALGQPVSGAAWSLRIYYKPFVQWIWMGPLCMVLGGILAASDRRYRLAARRQVHAQPAGLAPGAVAHGLASNTAHR
ncbi:MAG: cytochrome c-type biogenesis CcmF C-terminal domain-containing protein, partial [Gammaproteobacteria bacterium]